MHSIDSKPAYIIDNFEACLQFWLVYICMNASSLVVIIVVEPSPIFVEKFKHLDFMSCKFNSYAFTPSSKNSYKFDLRRWWKLHGSFLSSRSQCCYNPHGRRATVFGYCQHGRVVYVVDEGSEPITGEGSSTKNEQVPRYLFPEWNLCICALLCIDWFLFLDCDRCSYVSLAYLFLFFWGKIHWLIVECPFMHIVAHTQVICCRFQSRKLPLMEERWVLFVLKWLSQKFQNKGPNIDQRERLLAGCSELKELLKNYDRLWNVSFFLFYKKKKKKRKKGTSSHV